MLHDLFLNSLMFPCHFFSFFFQPKMLHAAILKVLVLDGESVYTLTSHPILLLIARIILVNSRHKLTSLQVRNMWLIIMSASYLLICYFSYPIESVELPFLFFCSSEVFPSKKQFTRSDYFSLSSQKEKKDAFITWKN